MTVTAEDAGTALHTIAQKMQSVGILTAEGRDVLSGEGLRVKKLRKSTAWQLIVDRGRPITFERAKDRDGQNFSIAITAKLVAVNQSADEKPPFASLDIALELHKANGDPLGRWHIDRANSGQPGPLYHLQFGGHNAGQRDLDMVVKEPRWCHPPMEVALLCEVVAANFFEKTWREKLRDDPSWCRAIQLYQRLCYKAYLHHIQSSLDTSRSTALNLMWNDVWI